MKFSTKAEYGLKATVNLANAYPGIKTIKEMSSEEGISLKYLERLMAGLAKTQVVSSIRGKEGGYKLKRSPKKIKVGEIIEALEGPLETRPCSSSGCALVKKCSSSRVWIELEKQIRRTLYKMKLSDLI